MRSRQTDSIKSIAVWRPPAPRYQDIEFRKLIGHVEGRVVWSAKRNDREAVVEFLPNASDSSDERPRTEGNQEAGTTFALPNGEATRHLPNGEDRFVLTFLPEEIENGWPSTAIVTMLPCMLPEPYTGLTLVSFIAQGGMGQVWAAKSNSLQRNRVAVKFFTHPYYLRPMMEDDCFQEARAGTLIKNDNVACSYDIIDLRKHQGGKWPALGLEMPFYVASLERVLRDVRKTSQRLPIEQSYNFLGDVEKGLVALHKKNLVHRDLKPSNVMFEFPDDRLYSGVASLKGATALVADLGTLCHIGVTPHVPLGKDDWKAPELFDLHGQPDFHHQVNPLEDWYAFQHIAARLVEASVVEPPPGYELAEDPKAVGHCIVCKATNKKEKADFALKFPVYPTMAALIHREAEFLKSAIPLDDPAASVLVSYHNDPVALQQGCIVLKWSSGGSLSERLQQTAWDLKRAAKLILMLTDMLGTFPAFDICAHCDLNPENILFEDETDNMPKIGGFGLAAPTRYSSLASDNDWFVLASRLGTSAYMAPQPAKGSLMETDERADIYSLGAILYRLITGNAPPSLALTGWTTVPIPDVLPTHLKSILAKCLQDDPSKRYPNANSLANDLRHFLDGKPVGFQPDLSMRLASEGSMEQNLDLIRAAFALSPPPQNKRVYWHHQEVQVHIDLVKTECNVHCENIEGRNLLSLAIEADAVELVRCLIDHLGFEVNEKDKWGWTPLHWAANVGNAAIAEDLLHRGADPAAENHAGGTTVYEAAYSVRDKGATLIGRILNYASPGQDLINTKSIVNLTPLMVACWRANPETVQFLLDMGATMDCYNDRNESAFELAVRAGCVESARALVNAGWKCKTPPLPPEPTQEQQEDTCGHLAAVREGWIDHFRNVEDWSGTEINRPYGEYRRTLLHEAADAGQLLIVQLLCKNPKINLFARNYHGRKPSDLAPKKRRDIMIFLHQKEQEAREYIRTST